MPLRDQLLGTTQPVLSISLEPGESIVAGTGDFAWMTDSIQMVPQPAGELGQALPLSAYMAKDSAGTIAFASRLPGSILNIEVAPQREFLVHRRGFLAGSPGVQVGLGFRQPLPTTGAEFVLLRICGRGKAWIDLSGHVVKRDLATSTSLRTHPWHIGMSDASVAVQMAALQASATGRSLDTAHLFAVLSGPGAVWLQSMPLLGAPQGRLAAGMAHRIPAAEGAAGFGALAGTSHIASEQQLISFTEG